MIQVCSIAHSMSSADGRYAYCHVNSVFFLAPIPGTDNSAILLNAKIN